MKTAVISFIFPIAEPFYQETLESIYQQTDQDFDTIIVDDGLNSNLLPSHVKHIHNTKKVGVIKLREIIFNKLINEKYDLLISIDSDDTMSNNRVEQIKKSFLKNSEKGFFVSNLHYMSNPEKKFFSIPKEIDDIKQILEHNFIGLSHTSLNLKILRDNNLTFNFPQNIIALDWYLASWYLFHGFEGLRSSGEVYYRLYKDNIAGEMSAKTQEEINRILNIKINHYFAILTLYKNDPLKQIIINEIERIRNLQSLNKDELLKVINNNIENNNNNYWWLGY
ncbi:glycosyltransferase family 2 protein [Emcibacteraceae bacterium]|nr:glycosyltransferase family 2 protein [Emcibacteraceae bacterium]